MQLRTLVMMFYGFLGLISLANGLWMLADPATWFTHIPAAVTDTGPLNRHFVHDVGIAYFVCGVAALWCAHVGAAGFVAHLGVTLFYVGHALSHVVEIGLGLLPHTHWWIDLPLVFVPALALAILTLPRVRQIIWSQTP
jgi:hypothetical protein